MTTTLYHNFDVELTRLDQKISDGALQSIPRYEARVTFSMPGSDYSPQILPPLPNAAEIEMFFQRLRYHRIQAVMKKENANKEIDFAKAMGRQLFNSLFYGELEKALNEARDQAEQKECGLRVRLFLQSPELQNFPWEYLCDHERNDFFLLIDTDALLVRHLGQKRRLPKARPIPPAQTLRVLVLIGGDLPDVAMSLDWRAEVTKLNEIFRKGSQPIEIVTPGPISLAGLQRWLVEHGQFQVVHYIGHGFFDETTKLGYLFFNCGRGCAKRVTDCGQNCSGRVNGEDLRVLLIKQNKLRLIVLNACFGSRSNSSDPFSSVATNMTLKNIPEVVAMQFDLLDTTAIHFSRHFYHALAHGYTVEEALAEARKAVYLHYIRAEFGIPVLYSRLRETTQLLKYTGTQSNGVPEYKETEANLTQLNALLTEVKDLLVIAEQQLLQPEEEKRQQARHMRDDLEEVRQKLEDPLVTLPSVSLSSNQLPAKPPITLITSTVGLGSYGDIGDPMLNLWEPGQLIEKGKKLFNVQMGKAKTYFELAVEKDSSIALGYYWLGKTLLALEETDRALKVLKEAIRLWPKELKVPKEVYRQLALAYGELQHPIDAIECLNQALEREPTDYESYRSRGRLYLGQGQLSEAGRDFTMALENAPKDGLKEEAELRWLRARCYDSMGPSHREDAYNDYIRYLDLTNIINMASEERRNFARDRIHALNRELHNTGVT